MLELIEMGKRDQYGHYYDLYKCSCGKEKRIQSHHVKSGATKSCGCLQEKHNMWKNREYSSWQSMKARCDNPNRNSYKYYGGRGIRVCKEWSNSFQRFFDDMGNRPMGTSLDRIDVNGDYNKDNCRWADAKTQARNKRCVRTVTSRHECER